MEPITMLAIGTVASAGLQWLNSSAALSASEDERARMVGLLNKIQSPNFDTSDITPEDLKLVGTYIPETTPYIEEIAPQQVKAQAAGAVAGRQAQLDALGQYRRLMMQGYDPQTAMEMAKAQRGAAAEATSARQTAQAEAARRGFGGGPSFYEAGADQGAMDRMAMMQQQALADAANRRLGALGQMAALGGQIRGEDVSLEQANINAINAFNQRNAARRQDWMGQQAAVRNQAQQYNLGERQRISDANIMAQNEADRLNRDYRNTMAQQQFQNAMSKVTGQQPYSEMARQDAYAGAAQTNKALQSMVDLGAKYAMSQYKPQKDDNLTKG